MPGSWWCSRSAPSRVATRPFHSASHGNAPVLTSTQRPAGVPYAAVDTDELDRVFPAPPDDPTKAALTGRNLRLLWRHRPRGCGQRG